MNAADAAADLYAELRVSDDASADSIKAAYRQLARELHPDQLGAVSAELRHVAEARMARVNAAYEVLSDPSKRREYDESRANILRGREVERLAREVSEALDSEDYARAAAIARSLVDRFAGDEEVVRMYCEVANLCARELASKGQGILAQELLASVVAVARDDDTRRQAQGDLELLRGMGGVTSVADPRDAVPRKRTSASPPSAVSSARHPSKRGFLVAMWLIVLGLSVSWPALRAAVWELVRPRTGVEVALESRLQRGDAALARSDYAAAVEAFEEALRLQPRSADVARRLGQARDGAERARAAQMQAKVSDAMARGRDLAQRGLWDQAVLAFQEAVGAQEDNAEAQEALASAERAKVDVEVNLLVAKCAQRMRDRDWDAAKECVARLLVLRPSHPEFVERGAEIDRLERRDACSAALLSARQAMDVSDWLPAEEFLERARAADPDSAEVRALLLQVAPKAAESRYENAMLAGPEAVRRHDWTAATAAFQAALKERPGDRAAEDALTSVARRKEALAVVQGAQALLARESQDSAGNYAHVGEQLSARVHHELASALHADPECSDAVALVGRVVYPDSLLAVLPERLRAERSSAVCLALAQATMVGESRDAEGGAAHAGDARSASAHRALRRASELKMDDPATVAFAAHVRLPDSLFQELPSWLSAEKSNAMCMALARACMVGESQSKYGYPNAGDARSAAAHRALRRAVELKPDDPATIGLMSLIAFPDSLFSDLPVRLQREKSHAVCLALARATMVGESRDSDGEYCHAGDARCAAAHRALRRAAELKRDDADTLDLMSRVQLPDSLFAEIPSRVAAEQSHAACLALAKAAMVGESRNSSGGYSHAGDSRNAAAHRALRRAAELKRDDAATLDLMSRVQLPESLFAEVPAWVAAEQSHAVCLALAKAAMVGESRNSSGGYSHAVDSRNAAAHWALRRALQVKPDDAATLALTGEVRFPPSHYQALSGWIATEQQAQVCLAWASAVLVGDSVNSSGRYRFLEGRQQAVALLSVRRALTLDPHNAQAQALIARLN
ncbi:MAG: DnaJ domain-containing protein [Phycisphaerales bacterium]